MLKYISSLLKKAPIIFALPLSIFSLEAAGKEERRLVVYNHTYAHTSTAVSARRLTEIASYCAMPLRADDLDGYNRSNKFSYAEAMELFKKESTITQHIIDLQRTTMILCSLHPETMRAYNNSFAANYIAHIEFRKLLHGIIKDKTIRCINEDQEKNIRKANYLLTRNNKIVAEFEKTNNELNTLLSKLDHNIVSQLTPEEALHELGFTSNSSPTKQEIENAFTTKSLIVSPKSANNDDAESLKRLNAAYALLSQEETLTLYKKATQGVIDINNRTKPESWWQEYLGILREDSPFLAKILEHLVRPKRWLAAWALWVTGDLLLTKWHKYKKPHIPHEHGLITDMSFQLAKGTWECLRAGLQQGKSSLASLVSRRKLPTLSKVPSRC